MAYTLTLSKVERDAIDWVGHRYFGGDELRDILFRSSDNIGFGDVWYESLDDMTFNVRESDAWAIKEGIDRDGLPCFGPDLCEKLYHFVDSIV